MLTLEQTLTHHKIRIAPDWEARKMQRDGSQWLRAYEFGAPPHSIKAVYFGCYKSGLNECWKGDDVHLTPEQKKKIDAECKKFYAEKKKYDSDEQIRVKLECQAAWPEKIDRGRTDYLTRKLIPELYGCKIDMNDHGAYLLVPARDADGELWNWQRVFNTKFSNGDKFFLAGGRKEGLFHALTPIHPDGPIYVCEGFATAASVALATSNSVTVIAAFDTGNLLPVGLALRAKYPASTLLFCADNDHWNTKPDGTPFNPGLHYASKAAEKCGGSVLVPRFKDPATRPTDFNDLHALEGLDQVKHQLLNQTPSSGSAEERDGPVAFAPGGESSIVRQILLEHGAGIVKENQDVFLYGDTHWQHMDRNVALDFFYQKIDAMAQGRMKNKDIMSCFNRLMRHIPNPPEGMDLFSPRPDCINLLNGTIHLVRDKQRKISIDFRPHSKEDYLVNILPFNYDPTSLHFNEMLMDVIHKVFNGDPDAKDKSSAVQEMYGSAICGLFPMLFMLFGAPGTGKSSIANVAKRMVGQGNTCQIPPTRWNGFHMWGMIGKQVNIDTDIPTNGKIQDDMIKKVIEGGSVFIQRKNMSDVATRLPACNIFCANKLPPFIDGSSGSQERRWILLEFNNAVIPAEESYDKTYWDAIFESDPQGVFNFALAGLARLCERQGAYTQSAAGKAAKRKWEIESEEAGQAVKDFLADVENGEAANDKNSIILVGDGIRIEPKHLWEVFKLTHQGNSLKYGGPTKSEFYAAMQRAGFERKKIEGVWYFGRIGVREAAAGKY